VAGYLFFTDHGRNVRRQLEPALEDFTRELISFRATVQKAAGVANEGWKLLNDALGDAGQGAALSDRAPDITVLRRHTMTGELETTNLLLGIMAAVSVLEALVIIGLGIAGFIAYRKVMELVAGLESRQVAPAMARVNAILEDVKDVTSKVKEETERVDQVIHHTIDRIDDTADRVRSNVRAKTSWVVGIVRGLRVAIEGAAADAAPGARNHILKEATWQTDTIVSTTMKAAAAGAS
jgi:hypothetical protein